MYVPLTKVAFVLYVAPFLNSNSLNLIENPPVPFIVIVPSSFTVTLPSCVTLKSNKLYPSLVACLCSLLIFHSKSKLELSSTCILFPFSCH